MVRPEAIAVLDIGKSNAKLALIDHDSRSALAVRTRPNPVRPGPPYRHYDVGGLWDWIVEGLAAFAAIAEVGTISTTTHGAAFALLDDDRLALPVLDYEDTGPEAVRDAYREARGGFAELLSPDLPNGLNAGRQLYWQSRAFPGEFARAKTILAYPQYWVWRLTGEKVGEVTSFGTHTDLWLPGEGRFSDLAAREGWTARFPKMVRAWDTVGPVLSAIVRQTGLPRDCRVVAGIHDSNASLLPHLLGRERPFSVLSTGTWMITLAPGGSLARLDPGRDCLAYVDAFGRPVPAAMVMGGREYEILAAGDRTEPGPEDIADVVTGGVMALPAFVPGSGPFAGRTGNWSVDPAGLLAAQRIAAASLYSALVADTCLGLAGAAGPTVVEGSFGRNRLFLAALARLTGRPVVAPQDPTGTTEGAALLASGPEAAPAMPPDPAPVVPLDIDLSGYAAAWRAEAEA